MNGPVAKSCDLIGENPRELTIEGIKMLRPKTFEPLKNWTRINIRTWGERRARLISLELKPLSFDMTGRSLCSRIATALPSVNSSLKNS
jgi:hypothetical protein